MSADTDNWTQIKIATPIPADVAATLMRLVGLAYPSAVISTAPNKLDWDREYAFVMLIDPAERAKRVTKKQAVEAKTENDGGDDLDFGGFDDGWVKMSTPEDLCLHLGSIAHAIFEAHEDAINYVEWDVRTPEGERYVLSVARSKEQTPHALRTKAEERLEQVRRALLRGGQTPAVRAQDALRILTGGTA